MKRIYITFGGAAYDETTARIVQDGPKFGADEVWVYDDAWLITTEFYEVNKWLWSFPHTNPSLPGNARGFGWFCWKPLVIMHALTRCQPDDIVLYTDADTYPIADLTPLYEECDRIGGQMMFRAEGWTQRQWCTQKCYDVMAMSREYRESDAPHGVARFMLFQAGKYRPAQFITEWLTYCLNPLCTSFQHSHDGPEAPGFIEHRTEQAIMTNLCHKYGLKLYREACQWGVGHDRDQELYPQTFVQVGTQGDKSDLRGSRFRNV
jgi:hypothetical protein